MITMMRNRPKLTIILVMLISPIVLVILNILGNNIRANVFANQLNDLPLPPNSELLSIKGRTEKYPQRPHCLILGQALLKTSLSIEEMSDFYFPIMNKTILKSPILSEFSLPKPLRFKFGPQWRIITPSAHFGDLLIPDSSSDSYLQLEIASATLPTYLDVRCW